MVPEFDYESQGVEDARIVKIDDLYYFTYTAYDRMNASGALATSKDLKKITKYGIAVSHLSYAEFVYRAEALDTVNKEYYSNQKFYYQKYDPEKKIMLWDKFVHVNAQAEIPTPVNNVT